MEFGVGRRRARPAACGTLLGRGQSATSREGNRAGLGWARLCCEIDAAGIAVRTGTEAAVLLQSLDSNDAEVICGLSSLSGILFDEFAGVTGRFRGEVLHAVHLRYLDPRAGPPR